LGNVATASLSTLLTLAGRAATVPPADLAAPRLRKLGLAAFQAGVGPQAGSGLQVLFGADADTLDHAKEYLADLRLRFWPQGAAVPPDPIPPNPVATVTGLAEFAFPVPPGAYWLSVEAANQETVVFALAVLPGRVTMPVFHRQLDGQTRVYQYMPRLGPHPYRPGAVDPNSDLKTTQRLELIQRFYLSGRLDYAYGNYAEKLEDLLYVKWEDPIAGCLGCYLLLRLGKVDELGTATNNLAHHFGELRDSHLLRAEYDHACANALGARTQLLAALDQGLPVFAEGLPLLLRSASREGLVHPRRRFLEHVYRRRVRGLLWSAWVPEVFAPGQDLTR
jgi:hypothetical protein